MSREWGDVVVRSWRVGSVPLLIAIGALMSACGTDSKAPTVDGVQTTDVTSSVASSAGPRPAPPQRPCTNPTSTADLLPRVSVVVEATVDPGQAVGDGASGAVIPLAAVKVLLPRGAVAPTEIVTDVAPTTPFLPAGRYVLLLEKGGADGSHFFVSDGRFGAYRMGDTDPGVLYRQCTDSAHPGPAVSAAQPMQRQALLTLAGEVIPG